MINRLKQIPIFLLVIFPFFISAQSIPAPEDVFGFKVGADYKLADYSQIEDYLEQLDRASDRVQKIEIGTSVLGRKMYLLFISSEENLADLDKHKAISAKMARARVSDDEAKKLSIEGKAVVWIDGGMHSTELAHGQMTSELAYTLATSEDAEFQNIRENVITLLMPVMNPDGLDIVVNWYKQNLGTPYETSYPPVLYHYYMGHDNNRDWFMNNMPETQAVTKVLYNDWYPQIVYNHHQSSPAWTKISIPPYADPVNPNIHPAVTTGVSEVGSAMSKRFSLENMPGAIADNYYTMFWNGGGRTVPYYHNMIGILTETGHRTPTPRYYDPQKLPKTIAGMPTDGTDIMYPNPWKGGESHFRDAVDYMLTATWTVLDLAADRKSDYLFNIYRMGKDAIDKGQTSEIKAYVIGKDQWDSFEAENLVNVLMQGGMEVHQATEKFKVDDQSFSKGSYVVYTDQAFRPYLTDLMEKQEYPTKYQYPGGPAKTPYDLAGWTLPLQMGVKVDRAAEKPIVNTELVSSLIGSRPAQIEGNATFGYIISVNSNASVAVTNRLLKSGNKAYRTTESMKIGKETFPIGSFVVLGSESEVKALSEEYGLKFSGLKSKPKIDLVEISLPKVGLYKSWIPNMDEGWTRFIMDDYYFDMDTLHDEDIQYKDLSVYDAIIIPSQDAENIMHGRSVLQMPVPFTGGLELEGTLALSNYVKGGGTLITFDAASDFVIDQFGLPLRNVVQEVPSKNFFIAGSLIKAGVNINNALAYGMQDTVALSFNRSRAFSVDKQRTSGEGGEEKLAEAPRPEVDIVVKYAKEDLLMSGWEMGAKRYLADKAALVNVPYGQGNIVLFAFRPQFRAQPRGTYKLIFNALYNSTEQ